MGSQATAGDHLEAGEETEDPTQEADAAGNRRGKGEHFGVQRPRAVVERRGQPHESSVPRKILRQPWSRIAADDGEEFPMQQANRRVRNRTHGGVRGRKIK